MKKSISLFSLGFILVSFSCLSAQSPSEGTWNEWNNYASTLNLTPEQMKKFEVLYQNFIKEINPIESNLTSRSLELRTLLAKSLPDNTAIINKQKQMSALQQKFQQKMLDYRLDALNILSTEQILLLPSDCCLGFTLGRGYGMGLRYGYGPGLRSGYGMGYGRGYGPGLRSGYGMGYGRGYATGLRGGYGVGYGRGYGRGRGIGSGMRFYNGRGRGRGLRGNGRYYPFRRR